MAKRGRFYYTPAIGKSLFGLRRKGGNPVPRFDPKTMEKLGERCVSKTWATRSKRHRKNLKKWIAKNGWQPNVNGPYSGFK